ncbi:MAG: lytic murein transglycosylase, partial [Pseudomonadota bacterium]|nr:lytic murein transglycosylase [Pseudomonadota bacterium]
MKTSIRRFSTIVILGMSSAIAQVAEVDMDMVQHAKGVFLERVIAEHEFRRSEITRILDNAHIDEQILEAISRPAERVLPWYEYREIFLNDARIRGGVEFWKEHVHEVTSASEAYSVAPELLVAILGIETYYGQRMGSYRVIDSLATLAFAYPPRSAFFTSELEAFFLLAREEGIDPEEVLGSYAGAM